MFPEQGPSNKHHSFGDALSTVGVSQKLRTGKGWLRLPESRVSRLANGEPKRTWTMTWNLGLYRVF